MIPTARQRTMRRIGARNMRRRGIESSLLGLQALGRVEAVARARGEDAPEFSADDVKHLLIGVGAELRRDPEFRARLDDAARARGR